MKPLVLLLLATMAASLPAGCTVVSTRPATPCRSVSLGRALLDLHAAHEKGIISDAEYQQARTNTLNAAGIEQPK